MTRMIRMMRITRILTSHDNNHSSCWVNNIITQEKGGGGRPYRKRKALELLERAREAGGDDEVAGSGGDGIPN